MFFQGSDDNYTRLKHALDINDLRDPDSQGVEFEVDETDLANEGKFITLLPSKYKT